MRARFLTPDQAVRALGVSRATMWRMLRSGKLRSYKVGGRRRIPADAVERLDAPALTPFTFDNPIFRLAGRGRGKGPGWSLDKYPHLGCQTSRR